MNIKEAKEYIKNTVNIYLKKDEFGDYRIPVVRQRPLFLLGAPGIGKTAIMEQIASELGIALVSYSMTHHTRQSALGLPFIEKKQYSGKEYDVSEYTMSEIIASIYETMEQSGVKEGILFLDEINCVSETLFPSMLQFLQYKVFGKHSVPEGWVIVTAGNPPEYNRSVREFDVVTLDRMKVLNVEADYPAWKQYATAKGIHGAILNFLENKKEYFYHIETTVDGRSYVTARGWEDLSDIIFLYEEEGLKVSESLIGQYLRNDKIVREFGAFYDLYIKYRMTYRVNDILSGSFNESVVKKASEASLDERLALVGILLDRVKEEIRAIMEKADELKEIVPAMRAMAEKHDLETALSQQIEARDTIIVNKEKAGSLSPSEKRKHRRIRKLYENMLSNLTESEARSYEVIKNFYNDEVSKLKEDTQKEKAHLHNMFEMLSSSFGKESNEMLVAVTELTVSEFSARFMNTFGSDDYDKYNELLMVTDRKDDLRKEILGIL